MKNRIWIYLFFFFFCFSGKLSAFFFSLYEEPPAVAVKTAFWIAGGSGGVFDEATVRTIAKTSSDWIVLNFPTNGVDPGDGYGMAAVQGRIRTIKPSLRTLNYCNKIMAGPSSSITWSTLGKTQFYSQPRVKDASGVVISNNSDESFGDFANTNYTAWFIGKVRSMITNMGADGVAFDLAMNRDPANVTLLKSKATNDPVWRANYIDGFDKASRDIRNSGKISFYNGLFYPRSSTGGAPDEYKWEQSQLHLLSNYADGAIIEFFGCRDFDNGIIVTNSFAEILTQVDAMIDMNARGKHLMVFARGAKSYDTYAQNYNKQRYLFSCYLLGASSRHSFKYHYTFWTTPAGGRSAGLDMYADQFYMQTNYLGSAGSYSTLMTPSASSGLYQRVFSKGIVLVHPHDSGLTPRTYYVSGVKYDRTGNLYSNTNVTLAAGAGILLTDDKLSLNEVGRFIDFNWTNSAGKHPVEMWSNAAVVVSGTNRILQCSTTPAGQEWMHDLMVFPVKHYAHQDNLQIRTYFRDSSAKIMALCEVDDSLGENNYVVFTITPGTTLGSQLTSDSRIIFRNRNFDTIITTNIPGAIYNTASPDLYQTVSINAGARFDAIAPRYTYKRWVFIRVIGNVNINWIQVGADKLYGDEAYYYSE
ncbi:MAG: hypothetical protein HOO88_05880 [Kiritimatiellaceae bacterium]|nr:hypothetical protein [Kiritimatiellaceae bacterium]